MQRESQAKKAFILTANGEKVNVQCLFPWQGIGDAHVNIAIEESICMPYGQRFALSSTLARLASKLEAIHDSEVGNEGMKRLNFYAPRCADDTKFHKRPHVPPHS